MRVFRLFVVALLLGPAACESAVDEAACPDEVRPAFEISVFQASNTEPVIGPLVWTRRGARTDTLSISDHKAYGPLGVSGIFDVSVSKAGYADWHQDSVVVEDGLCGPETVYLDVFLER